MKTNDIKEIGMGFFLAALIYMVLTLLSCEARAQSGIFKIDTTKYTTTLTLRHHDPEPTDTVSVVMLYTSDSVTLSSMRGYAIRYDMMLYNNDVPVFTVYLTLEKKPIPKDVIVWMSRTHPPVKKSENVRPRYEPTVNPQMK